MNGALQPDHGLALAKIDAVQQLGLSVDEPEPRPILDEDLEQQRIDQAAVDEVISASAADPANTDNQPAVVREMPVRAFGVFEHADLLVDALESATRRLLIVSPWVRSAVVTTDFLAKLERRLKAGVEVTIAHGIGDDDSGSDEFALQRLANLAARYRRNFTFARLRNTHAKILIFDGQWVSTSFNWLSFRGDPERTYRMEEGTLVQIPSRVDEAYDRYRKLIAEQLA